MAAHVSGPDTRCMIQRASTTLQHRGGSPRLDPASRAWLETLRSEGARYDDGISRLHSLLLSEARYEVRRRTAALEHPSGRDLDDLAMQAADDAVVAILGKLHRFRGDALFTTWARRFVEREVPGKIRRRLGHGRETPTGTEALELRSVGGDDAQALSEAADLADTLGDLIVHRLTSHQREVLVALAVDGVDPNDLAARLDSTPGAVYKTFHDARSKLKRELACEQGSDRCRSFRSRSPANRADAARLAQRILSCAGA